MAIPTTHSVVTDFGFTDDVADAVAIQPLDGKIVVAGDLAQFDRQN